MMFKKQEINRAHDDFHASVLTVLDDLAMAAGFRFMPWYLRSEFLL
jgi:hypothetical protein